MRFLSVADRELRSAARRKGTYRVRWVTALLFFGLLIWLMWAFDGFTDRRAASRIFNVYSFLGLLYCLLLSTASTADCISAERRAGTLGLLFLTNLNSAEIIAGKLCSTALASVYGLLAIFPMLALPLLMGGITLAHFARTVLGLLIGILFALSAGFLASVLCKRQFTAVALAMGLVIGLPSGAFLAAAAADSFASTQRLAGWLASFSPFYGLLAADGTKLFRSNHYWLSTATLAGISCGWLGLTVVLLARTWRDRVKSVRWWHRLRFWRRRTGRVSAAGTALRRRQLGINPIFWLSARQRAAPAVVLSLILVAVLITPTVTAPFFIRMVGRGTSGGIDGIVFAWMWTGLAIHGLVLYYAAMSASQRLAEDKVTGALELILSTPTTERTIRRGLWLGYARRMLLPGLLAVLIHCLFLWMMVVMMTLDPPGAPDSRNLLGVSPGQLFWSAVFGLPVRGLKLDWEFGFILRIPSLLLVLFASAWLTLGWVGRWLGLRMKHPGFAPMASLALLVAPPVLLFSLLCYLAAELELHQLPEREFLPLMMSLGVAIGLAHFAAISAWTATRLRKLLRPVAMSRYQPLPAWRWRLPRRRTVWRVSVATVSGSALLAFVVVGYYRYQTWSSQREWVKFQRGLTQRGESLSLSSLVPPAARDDANFARSPVFVRLLSHTNRQSGDLQSLVSDFAPPGGGAAGIGLNNWSHQSRASLEPFAGPSGQRGRRVTGTNESDYAARILKRLETHREIMREVAAAAAHSETFQLTTNQNARAVINRIKPEEILLERLHLLFQVRSCAALTLGQGPDPAADVLTGLRLARLARRMTDTRSVGRVHVMLIRSLQPLWDGLSTQHWTEAELAAFQRELGSFDLFRDYTNAVRRAVLAHIELWSALPAATNSAGVLYPGELNYAWKVNRNIQPSAWWFNRCIELYELGQRAIQRVNPVSGRIQESASWSNPYSLPLDSASHQLLQEVWWNGLPRSAGGGPPLCIPDGGPNWVGYCQTSFNQAMVACALERFRLANGAYPATLDAMVPRFLAQIPRDAVSGRPLIYQTEDSNSFILRGVGANGVDDRNGKIVDDWLWAYSTNRLSTIK